MNFSLEHLKEVNNMHVGESDVKQVLEKYNDESVFMSILFEVYQYR